MPSIYDKMDDAANLLLARIRGGGSLSKEEHRFLSSYKKMLDAKEHGVRERKSRLSRRVRHRKART